MATRWRLERGRLSGLAIGTVAVVVPFGDELRIMSPDFGVLLRLRAGDVTQKTADGGLTLRLTSPHYGIDATFSSMDAAASSPGATDQADGHEDGEPLSGGAAARIEVATSFSRFAYFYALQTPTVEVNGERYRRPWGVATFDVAPGHYAVAVSYPWAFSGECGRNEISFEIGAGEVKRVSYRPWPIRYLRGRIRVETVAPAPG